MVPLLNALNVAYDQAGYTINYGIGRGLGSAASGLSAMAFGFIIAKFGDTWMILILVAFRVLSMIAVAGYPAIRKTAPAEVRVITKEEGRVVLEIILYEGRNRQIRKMCEEVGLEVARLKPRWSSGSSPAAKPILQRFLRWRASWHRPKTYP